MAKKVGGGNTYRGKLPKKTRQGFINLTKRVRKGGAPNGSTISKSFMKRSRWQCK